MTKATIVEVNNPFSIGRDREVKSVDTGKSIQHWVDNNPKVLERPVVCIYNGAPVLRRVWQTIVIENKDVVVFFHIPEGGGGGKSPIFAVLGILLLATGIGLAFFVPAGLSLTTLGVTVATGLIVVGGGLLVAGLLASPDQPSTDFANQLAKPSPSYSLTAQGNYARLGEPIPIIYGKHLVFPDFASQPYQEFIDNEQWLNHVLVVGRGHLMLSNVKLGETPIDAFFGATYDVVYAPFDDARLLQVAVSPDITGQELQQVPPIVDIAPDPMLPSERLQRNSGENYAAYAVRYDAYLLQEQADQLLEPARPPLENCRGGRNIDARCRVRNRVKQDTFDRLLFDYKVAKQLVLPLTADEVYSDYVDRYEDYISMRPSGDLLLPEEQQAEQCRRRGPANRPSSSRTYRNCLNRNRTRVSNYEALLRLYQATAARDTTTGGFAGSYIIGPLYITPQGFDVDRIDLDIVLPRGLYRRDSTSGELLETSVGLTVQIAITGHGDFAWHTLQDIVLTESTIDPIRKTYSWPGLTLRDSVNSPRNYVFRIINNTADTDDAYRVALIQLASLKVFGPPDYRPDYGNSTIVILKLKASEFAQRTKARKFNCVAHQSDLRARSPDGQWVAPREVNDNPIFAALDMLTSVDGANLPDSKIDLEGCDRIAFSLTHQAGSTFEANGRYRPYYERHSRFDAVFDRQSSLWESLKLACRAARSVVVIQGGKITIVRDKLQTLPVAMFSTRNIVRNSFSVQYKMATEDSFDGVEVEYLDRTIWKPATVSHNGKFIGDTVPDNPAKIKFFGCTRRSDALREAKYLARNNVLRRRTMTLTTELEGYIPTFGDLVIVSHDMPEWGTSGDVVGVKGDDTVVLSEPLQFEANVDHYIAFRSKGGAVSGPHIAYTRVTPGDTEFEAVLHPTTAVATFVRYPTQRRATFGVNDDKIELYYGTSAERTHYAFGPANKFVQRGVVKSVTPRGNFNVQLVIVVEHDDVHRDD